ncbi:hypothetical protein PMAC_000825 [Pneumocystis sp. 'macacae']|nr:hypothetical protein PMAC_000825 [Pneumocystis sp. 'macacae']
MKTNEKSKISNILSKKNIYIDKSQNPKHLNIKKNIETNKHNFTTSQAFEILINLLEPKKHEQKKIKNEDNKETEKNINLIYKNIKEKNKIIKLDKEVTSYSNLGNSDSDNCENNIDPFYHHYQSPNEEKLNLFVQEAIENKWIQEKKEIIGIGKLVQYKLSKTDNFGIKLKSLAHDINNFKDTEVEYRDQGFTRPKILILLPTKNSCLEVVQTIIDISGTEQQENKKRFIDEYSIELDNINQSKPADYKDLFIGNTDDMFRLGIKITRKTLKIFSEFYSSDIILASPLGLRLLIDEKGGKKKNRDYLSSIEIVILDNANALQMQNWEHVSYIFDNLNILPNEVHECNFSRVRNWYLDGNSKFLRQTLIFAQYLTPEINSLFINYLFNISGKNKIKQTYKGSIEDVGYKIKQIFLRLHSSDISMDPDTKFSYFKTSILPNIIRSGESGFLIFISSYFDFVRIRNYLNKEEISFTFISEYSSNSEVSKARSYFNTSNKKILLYTERVHYYRRYNIKGVNTLIFYSLPENPLFYPELIRFMIETQGRGNYNKHSKALFSKWDALKLERIIGSKRVNLMCHGVNDIFAFL